MSLTLLSGRFVEASTKLVEPLAQRRIDRRVISRCARDVLARRVSQNDIRHLAVDSTEVFQASTEVRSEVDLDAGAGGNGWCGKVTPDGFTDHIGPVSHTIEPNPALEFEQVVFWDPVRYHRTVTCHSAFLLSLQVGWGVLNVMQLKYK